MAKVRSDGRRVITFRYNGKKYFAYGSTVSEAREKARKLRQELEDNTYQQGKGLTIDGFVARWHDARRDKVKGATMRRSSYLYKIMSDTPIDKAGTRFGSLKVKDVERQNIIDLQATLKSTISMSGRVYTSRTINDMIALLRQIFRDAMIERIIQWNPAEGVSGYKRTEPKARDTIHRALTEDETKAFFEAAKGCWYEPLFRFLLATGCRIGEAGAIKESKIRNGMLYIDCTITRDELGYYDVGDDTKTPAGQRAIPYTDAARAAIEDQREQNNIMFGNLIDINGTIFRTSRGNIISDTKVNESIARICKKIGIERFTAHAFRDTFATRAIESGMEPKILQEILGHSDIRMTMNIYAHVMQDTKIAQMSQVKIGI